ncbi:formylglycine-generating enzyme family protein [Alistipes sp.]|uniref:formylglycine-generating enzyme family protein n=1 Tax=Alistipes sp. TaxID=1872444 RepID=UPI0038B2AA2F
MKKLFLAMALAIVTGTVVSAQGNSKENTIVVPTVQTDKDGGYDGSSATNCGIKFNIRLSGVTKVELESVDGNPLAGTARMDEDADTVETIEHASSVVTFSAADESGFTPGKDYYISTLPCDLYGGYRLSIYRNGLVAHYFGVHQTVEPGTFISPDDLVESELEFDKPGAPLVEEGRPKMDSQTHNLFIQYRRNPTEANRQALLDRMGIRYDKVVARKKNKLRELEREAKTYSIVEHMQGIVNEMVKNRDIRIQQQFLRFIDPRRDEDPNDGWMVLRGASAPNAYIGYTPVTNAEYAMFKSGFTYDKGKENYPVVNITIDEAEAYCDWLTEQDRKHVYRLPSEEEWILGAGHMPKDVAMNANRVKSGLTAVDAYSQSTGACGGIDFWGNCWEWTSSTDANGRYIVKGGAWDSKRDDCRSEKSDDVRIGTQGYANIGFRVVRTDF